MWFHTTHFWFLYMFVHNFCILIASNLNWNQAGIVVFCCILLFKQVDGAKTLGKETYTQHLLNFSKSGLRVLSSVSQCQCRFTFWLFIQSPMMIIRKKLNKTSADTLAFQMTDSLRVTLLQTNKSTAPANGVLLDISFCQSTPKLQLMLSYFVCGSKESVHNHIHTVFGCRHPGHIFTDLFLSFFGLHRALIDNLH